MIVEERIYTLRPGQAGDYFRLYEAEGMDVQTRTLGGLRGYYATEFGPLNQVVHFWQYDDVADRAARRARLAREPAWQRFAPKLRELVVTMENKLLVPAPFSPDAAAAADIDAK